MLEEKALLKEKYTAAKVGIKSESSFFGAGMEPTTRGTSVNRAPSTIEDTLEVNDMLLDAIKAKLAILDNLE